MKVLVLGAYGLIGQAVVGRLCEAGHDVTGVGRDITVPRLRQPWVDWREADIAKLDAPGLWWSLLDGMDAVVNASGALQNGLRDNVSAVQDGAMKALFEACRLQNVRTVVQISAPGVTPDARTVFLSSKARADQALVGSDLDWVILRPGLVIAPQAYGGTALIRALAAMPFLTPVTQAGAMIRTVGVRDVAQAVSDAVSGAIPPHSDLVLAEAKPHTLMDIVILFRCWLGEKPAPVMRLPGWIGGFVAVVADLAGWMGWRSPLRSTALSVLAHGGVTDIAPSGPPCASLQETLAAMPATPQDRWFARLWLLKPLILLLLAAFWVLTGVIGFVRQEASQALLKGAIDPGLAYVLVLTGSAYAIALGVGVLFRPMTRPALILMLLTTLAAMIASAVAAPLLWVDPLGPMVKTLPLIGLILAALAILEDR